MWTDARWRFSWVFLRYPTTNQCQTDDVNLTGPSPAATATGRATPPGWQFPFTLKLKFIWIYNILFQFKFKSANICHEHCQVQEKTDTSHAPFLQAVGTHTRAYQELAITIVILGRPPISNLHPIAPAPAAGAGASDSSHGPCRRRCRGRWQMPLTPKCRND